MVKKSRGNQYIFVNKRFIKSNYLNHAIRIAYEHLVPKDHFPFHVLLLEVDPAMIDVNIHPTKQEVKFENERIIYNYIRVTVKHALGKYSITPSLDFDTANTDGLMSNSSQRSQQSFSGQASGQQSDYTRPQPASNKEQKEKWLEFYDDMSKTAPDIGQSSITLSSDWAEGEDEIKSARKSFQVHDSYIISPIKSGWIVIDQSTAHERILYEQHLKSLRNQKGVAQTSLFPETIKISPANEEVLDSLLEQLRYIGFQIEKISQQTYLINALPIEGLQESSTKFLDDFVESYSLNQQEEQLDFRENIARTVARQMRIRKGKSLTDKEIHELIDKLFACEMPYTSPCGKKCFITFGLDEVERRFRN